MKSWLCCGIVIFCTSSFAASHTFVSLNAGQGIIPNAGKSQRFMMGESTYDYAVKHTVQVPNIIGASIGKQFQFTHWEWQLGLSYYVLSSYTVKGTLTQGPDSFTANQYNYNYNILSRQLLIENKLLTTWRERYHPFVIFGFGESFNNTSHFQTNAPFFQVFTPQFDAKTNKSFTYSAGLGMDVDIIEHWRAGASYRFTDLGKADLGTGNIDIFSTPTLRQNHLYAQELLVQLTWII